MFDENSIRQYPATQLSGVRSQCHRAVQLLSLAARANRTARDDDTHASLVWDANHHQFLTLPLAGRSGDYHVGLVLRDQPEASMTLVLLRERVVQAQCSLVGMTYAAALQWLDEQLVLRALQLASAARLPYELPRDVAVVETFESGLMSEASLAFANWFTVSFLVLSDLAERKTAKKVGIGPIWVWPHHFDMASYFTLTDQSDESAPGIGIGFSPGDASYAQPYLYVNPWPAPNPNTLPAAPAPGHWHTDGFTGLVLTAEALLASEDVQASAQSFCDESVRLSRNALGF